MAGTCRARGWGTVAADEPGRAAGPGHGHRGPGVYGSENGEQGTGLFRCGLWNAPVSETVELNGKGEIVEGSWGRGRKKN